MALYGRMMCTLPHRALYAFPARRLVESGLSPALNCWACQVSRLGARRRPPSQGAYSTSPRAGVAHERTTQAQTVTLKKITQQTATQQAAAAQQTATGEKATQQTSEDKSLEAAPLEGATTAAAIRRRAVVPERYADVTFRRIYRFPHILTVRFLARMKVYQTAITLVCLPVLGGLYSGGLVSGAALGVAGGVASLAGLMLYVIGAYVRKLVGVISVGDGGDVIRIARMTFWGNRRDVYVAVKDVIPLTDYVTNTNDIYVELRRFDSSDVLLLSLKFGGIDDPEEFMKIFGHIDPPK